MGKNRNRDPYRKVGATNRYRQPALTKAQHASELKTGITLNPLIRVFNEEAVEKERAIRNAAGPAVSGERHYPQSIWLKPSGDS